MGKGGGLVSPLFLHPGDGELVTCDDCGREVGPSEFMTVVDPSGKHDWDTFLVCDSCMGSERWDTWRATHYPEWPLPQLNEMVGG